MLVSVLVGQIVCWAVREINNAAAPDLRPKQKGAVFFNIKGLFITVKYDQIGAANATGRDSVPPRWRTRGAKSASAHAFPAAFMTSSILTPRTAGESTMWKPAADMAAILSSAPPFPPEMMAPA